MKTFDTLYARNSNGKINEWSVKVQDSVPVFHVNMGGPTPWPQMIISEGIIDGQKTSTTKDFHKGKNIGKMNETSAYEQACSEAKSRWQKKKKQGYKSLDDLGVVRGLVGLNGEPTDATQWNSTMYFNIESLLEDALPKNRTDANDISKPMKAQPYFKDNGEIRIKFPCYGQPKLNGFRVMSRIERVMEGEGIFASEVLKPTFRSKEGLRYTVLEHIEEDVAFIINNISDLMSIPPKDIALDGEMYIEGEILSEISSAVRKKNSKTPLIKFCVFDIAVEGILQDKRVIYLNDIQRMITNEGLKSILNIETILVNDNAHAQTLTDQWIKLGYEGGIFRDRKAHYQFGKRPQTMVKLKRFQDKEFRITDVVGGENSPELGVFVCIAENGKAFKCTPEGTHEQKKEYLTNKSQYIGKKLTVRFFERTKDDLPFHAVGVTVRDYE